MYHQFDDGAAKVMATLTSDSHRRANRHYFALLREHLVQNKVPYSHHAALDWLSESERVMPHWKYVNCRNVAFKLDDVLTNGVLTSAGHYPFDDAPKYTKLSVWSKELLVSALSASSYTGSSKNMFRIAVAEFLWLLEEHGVNGAEEIRVEHFRMYLKYVKESRNDIGCKNGYIRYVGVFLSEVSESVALCALAQKCRHISSIIILDDLPSEHKNTFWDAIASGKTDSIPTSDFFEIVQCEDEKLADLRYSDSTRKQYLDFCKSFGLFLLLNELDFSPQLIKLWADYCGRGMIVYPRLMGYPQKNKSSEANIPKRVLPKLTQIDMLPIWSRELLEQYTIDERCRGQAESTLETQKYACLKFLQFLEQQGVTSCANITPEVLKAFNIADQHSTPEAKKSYNSRIGRFLAFLGERGLVSETLRLALPCKVAKKVSIIKILNDAEVSALYSSKDNAESPLALRDAAIAMIILRMGLRAGDITSLTYRDISWEKRLISISQNKTTKPLLLPMPVMVGNCIYRYMTKGRPKSEADYIFISHNAPYSKLKSSACADATKRILFGSARGGQGYGSRILRKTFASRMLKSGNSADTIANLLGHDGTHTVMTYLSTDDEKMRMCALPAGKVASI